MQCPTCNAEMRQIPAGVSKSTGKPYSAFMACPNKCPKQTNYNPQIPKPAPPTYTPVKETDWDKISWGKCKHAYLVEAYKKWLTKEDGRTTIREIEQEAEKWADMSMRKLSSDEITYDGPALSGLLPF
jgi:hypothetical protein